MTLILSSSLAIPNYVVGDNCQMFGHTLSVLDSIMLLIAIYYVFDLIFTGGSRGRDRMVVGFIITYAISAYRR
jgi:hypothetical protein